MLMPNRWTRTVRLLAALTLLFSCTALIWRDQSFPQLCEPHDLIAIWSLPMRIFTASSPSELFSLILLLWFFGCPLEQKIGARKFLILYLSCGALAWLATALLSTPNHAPCAAITALLLAYAGSFTQERTTLFLTCTLRTAWLALGFATLHCALQLG